MHIDILASLLAGRENHDAIDEGIESVVSADSYIQTRVMLSAALALQDVTGFAIAAAEDFHAQAFAF